MSIKKGKVVFETTKLDVTDPGYDRSIRCRLSLDIVPGEYIYKAYIRKVKNWGNRVTKLSIINVSAKSRARLGKCVGEIGVDAGLAGFFENKPDYEAKKDNAFKCNGVLSTSGVGDGFYAVYELLDWKDNRCGYTILFI